MPALIWFIALPSGAAIDGVDRCRPSAFGHAERRKMRMRRQPDGIGMNPTHRRRRKRAVAAPWSPRPGWLLLG